MLKYWLATLCVVATASLASVVSDANSKLPPPLALANDVAMLSAASSGEVRAVLDSNGERHVRWVAPEVNQTDTPPQSIAEITEWFENGGRVFVSSPSVVSHLGDGVTVKLIGEYRRPLRVWMRHTGTKLYEVTRSVHVQAPTSDGEGGEGAKEPVSMRQVSFSGSS
ncbi:MAG: hypothetical protein AAF499_16000 [Pseudomonadota bacterium]